MTDSIMITLVGALEDNELGGFKSGYLQAQLTCPQRSNTEKKRKKNHTEILLLY